MGKPLAPTEEFAALAKRYAIQRSRGAFPSGMFNAAAAMEWVDINTPVAELDPPAHPPLTDAELSAIAGKPVFDIRIEPTKHTPRNINWNLSKAGARAHWKVVKEELKRRMGEDMFNQLESPESIRESHGVPLLALSFQLNMKEDPEFPPLPALSPDHPLYGMKIDMDWPRKHRSRQVSDVSIIRTPPTNFGSRQMWEHLSGLPSARIKGLRIPKQDNTYTMLQAHEWGHTVQPYPSTCPHNEAYYGEFHADDALGHISARLGVGRGHVETFFAARAIISTCYSGALGNSAWSCHTTTPAHFFGGFRAWPISKLNAMRRQVRAYTDLTLVGENSNLTSEEIHAFTAKDAKYFKKYDKRREEVSRQLGRARLAEAKVASKPALMVERRLLALKKIWNDKSIKMDREMLFMVGHTLEAASLFWPGLMDPKIRLTPKLCAAFRPRKRPAPKPAPKPEAT